MKFLKRLFTVFLVLAMTFPLAVPSAAEQQEAPALDADALENMLEEYLNKNNLNKDHISVGFCYLDTDETWYYNADSWYYSASTYKVPVSMLIMDKINEGTYTMDTQLEGYSIEYLMENSVVYSNNGMAYILMRGLGGDEHGGKCSDQTIKYTDLDESYFDPDFFDYSYYSARYYTEVLTYLYHHSEEYEPVINFMKRAEKGEWYYTNLGYTYEIAQKYGALSREVTNADYIHCGAIIYTPHPIAVVVMTRDYPYCMQKYIADIGEMLVNYTLEYDQKVEAYSNWMLENMAVTVESEPEEALTFYEDEEEETATESENVAVDSSLEPAENALKPEHDFTRLFIIGGIGGIVVLLLIASIAMSGSRRSTKPSKRRRRY